MVKIIYKHTELPWEQKWQSLSPIFLWAKLLNRSAFWKRYIDDIFSLWEINREELQQFIEQANNHHPTIKFTAEISETEITFLDTVVYKGNRFITESVLDVRTHYKATETFQYTHFSSCHPPGVKRGFIKGEALRLLRRNSTKATFEEKNQTFRMSPRRVSPFLAWAEFHARSRFARLTIPEEKWGTTRSLQFLPF